MTSNDPFSEVARWPIALQLRDRASIELLGDDFKVASFRNGDF